MNLKTISWVFVLIGFAASLWSAAMRWQTETRNRSIEITLDYNEVRAIAISERQPIPAILRRFRQAGVTSIALPEETISGLEESRILRAERFVNLAAQGQSFQLPFTPSQDAVAFYTGNTPSDVTLRHRLRNAITKKLGLPATDAKQRTADAKDKSSLPLVVDASYTTLRGLGVGLAPDTVQQIQEAGLAVVGRVANYNGVRPEGINWELNELQKSGIKTVIFAGDEILGYRGYMVNESKAQDSPPGIVTSTTDALHATGLWLGIVEFGKQKGEAEISRSAQDRVVRVHTVTGAEMLQANVPTNVQRFTLAARERNIRLLYIRLFTDERNPLEYNSDYIEKVVEGLERGNLTPGIAHGYGELTTPPWLRFLIALGIAAAWLLLVHSITLLFDGAAGPVIVTIASLGTLALVAFFLGLTGAKLGALAASCIYPALALLYRDLSRTDAGRSPTTAALQDYLLACGITTLGIAAIVGLLSDRLFLIKGDAFIGIKVSQLIPILLVGAVYGLNLRATTGRPFSQALRDTGQRILGVFDNPIRIWQFVAGLGALVVLALLVLRSGNDPGVGVSPLELKIRAILDQVLYARPRFKEFLFGHPALILALLFAALGKRSWALPLLVIGAIGQASLLNTFCHLHTPLLVSLWRAGLGIAIGAALGFAVFGAIRRWIRQTPFSPQPVAGAIP